MGLKDWEAAPEAIDTAIAAQKLRYFRGRWRGGAEKWREYSATVTIEKPDDILVELWSVKAAILDQLGRKSEATAMRKRSLEPVEPGYASSYWLFHQRLKKIREAGGE